MIKVVSVENMRQSDAHTICHKTSSRELMARAAKGIFDAVCWRAPVAIVCGSGNNAGDGFALALLLQEAKIECEIFLIGSSFSDDGRYFFSLCEQSMIPIRRGVENLELTSFKTVVDCLLGTGFHGSVKEPYRTAIELINQSGAYVVSTDINSGLGGDSGLFDLCVKSDLTVSIGNFKSGLFLNAAKDVIKEKVNCDIGIDLLREPAYLIQKDDIKRLFAPRPNYSNKGDYGYVALIGGSLEYSGAAKLANLALSALRAGAGVSKLAVPECIAQAVLPYILESTLFVLDSKDGAYTYNKETTARLIQNTKAVAIGMGMGRTDQVSLLLEHLLCEYDGRLIIDADGLNVLSTMDRALLKNASCRVILTPHPKEFERLYGEKIEDFQNDLVLAAKRYAADTDTILLLKGPTTIITDGREVYLTDRGCAGMATAGSGDVLSGILAGMLGWARDDDLLLSVSAGAYLNGLSGQIAAENVPEIAMTASDTVKNIPKAIKAIID